MERKILDFNWRDGVSNKELRRIVNTGNVAQRAADLKWKWGGHVVRLPQNLWALITTWDPYEGRRTRGRPRTKWADALKHIAGSQWSRVARNREKNGDLKDRTHKHNKIKNAVKSVRMKLHVQKPNKYSGSVKLML